MSKETTIGYYSSIEKLVDHSRSSFWVKITLVCYLICPITCNYLRLTHTYLKFVSL